MTSAETIEDPTLPVRRVHAVRATSSSRQPVPLRIVVALSMGMSALVFGFMSFIMTISPDGGLYHRFGHVSAGVVPWVVLIGLPMSLIALLLPFTAGTSLRSAWLWVSNIISFSAATFSTIGLLYMINQVMQH